jgi:RNA polymerase sigma-70 factor (ECF subfamily)
MQMKRESGVTDFETLYRTYNRLCYKAAYAILNSHTLSEDAVQDAFLKLSRNMSLAQNLSGKKTGVFFIILGRSSALDIYRRERGRPAEDEGVDIAEAAAPDETVSRERYDDLRRYIDELPSVYSDTMTLKFVLGYTNSEIAKFYGVKTTTVEMRLYRGKRLLANRLREERQEEEQCTTTILTIC